MVLFLRMGRIDMLNEQGLCNVAHGLSHLNINIDEFWDALAKAVRQKLNKMSELALSSIAHALAFANYK